MRLGFTKFCITGLPGGGVRSKLRLQIMSSSGGDMTSRLSFRAHRIFPPDERGPPPLARRECS